MSKTRLGAPAGAAGDAEWQRRFAREAGAAAGGCRRSLLRVGAGLATVVAVTSLYTVLWSAGQRRGEVLVLARPVTFGQVLGPGDVKAVQVASMPGVPVLPASVRGRVVGRRVLDALPAGTLLSDPMLASSALSPGQSAVSLLFKEGHYPPLAVGDQIAVRDTEAGSSSAGSGTTSAAGPSGGAGASGPGDVVGGVVLGVRSAADSASGSGSVVVTLAMGTGEALRASGWASPAVVTVSPAASDGR